MSLHLLFTNDNPDLAAVAYGPIILAGDMGTGGIDAPAPFARDQLDYRNTPVPESVISALSIKGRKLTDCISPLNGKPLAFKTSDAAFREITLIPYYKINRQRYVIYWNLK